MTRSVLFYPDVAMDLNKAVQEEIAPHLFLFCNYNPTPLKAFSADARFFKAVLNFYKLLIDSGVVNRVKRFCKVANDSFDCTQLNGYAEWASNARTVAGHNLSLQNGTGEGIVKYERWLKTAIGKAEIECAEDYERALQRLEGMATSAVDILKDFVDHMSGNSKKDEVIAVWEQSIIEFYCKDMNKSIFWGQLKDAYESIHGEEENSGGIDFELSRWIQNAYYRKEEEEIKNLEDMLYYVNHSNLSETLEMQIRQKIQAAQLSMAEREAAAAAELGMNVTDLRSRAYNYKNHYYSRLKNKLNTALIQIKQTGSGTMMPHDIMQKIIADDFELF